MAAVTAAVTAVGSQAYGAYRTRKAASNAANIQGGISDQQIQYQQDALKDYQQRTDPFLNLARDQATQGLPMALQMQQDAMARYRQQEAPQIDTSAERVYNNPLFQAVSNDVSQRLLGNRAARGKLGSGGTNVGLNNALGNLALQFQGQDINNQMQNIGYRQNQMINDINNSQTQFANLFNLFNTGSNIAANQGQAGLNVANSIGNALQNKGNAFSQAEYQKASATNNMLNNIASMGMYGYSNGMFGGLGNYPGLTAADAAGSLGSSVGAQLPQRPLYGASSYPQLNS